MNHRIHPLLALSACVASLFIGALATYELIDAAGRFTGKARSFYIDVDSQAAGFGTFVDRWNRYLIKRGGFIPADPYRGLIDDGVVGSFDELRGIVFNRCLPPRINPRLAQNPRRAVFWQDRGDLHEIWTAYADGTWARLTYSQSSAADDDWCASLRGAGYPQWKTLADKDKWTVANKDRLVWNDARRMYVPVADAANSDRSPVTMP